ncbi:MAG: 4Fe-4S dicluster domain-containing protein, partial [Syntrophorhabdaceae bacterium]|nr:4Fe-4S dicluster domain-containing protein [Syntrophorhabdaceae bacterium]
MANITSSEKQEYVAQKRERIYEISVNNRRCRKCSYCIQICTAKAIKLQKDSIKILHERCIMCGSCITECPQKALSYRSGLHKVVELLADKEKTIACVDPAFPAVLDRWTPGQFVTVLKKAGFTEVWEGAFGAELVSQAYRKLLSEDTDKPLISSFCPVVVFYIQKYLTSLIPNLVPIVSPMIAIGRVARAIKGSDWKVIYITPCLAQLREMSSPEVAGAIDHVITFKDLKKLVKEQIEKDEDIEETAFDGPKPFLGRVISVIGGLYRSTGSQFDILMDDVTVTYGHRRTIGSLNQLATGYISARFFDFLFCHGCVDGPFIKRDLSVIARRQKVVRYAKQEMEKQDVLSVITELDKFEFIDLKRNFLNMEQRLPTPTEEQIKAVLKKIDKMPPNH